MKWSQSTGDRRRLAPEEKGSSKCQGLWQDRGWHIHQLQGAVGGDCSEQTEKGEEARNSSCTALQSPGRDRNFISSVRLFGPSPDTLTLKHLWYPNHSASGCYNLQFLRAPTILRLSVYQPCCFKNKYPLVSPFTELVIYYDQQ